MGQTYVRQIMDVPSLDGDEGLLATIIQRKAVEAISSGIEFFTDESSSVQVGVGKHQTGKRIAPHLHRMGGVFHRATPPYEVIMITMGIVEVTIFNSHRQAVASHLLEAGDILIQHSGGHSFLVVVGPWYFIEVKSGPYRASDKEYFS